MSDYDKCLSDGVIRCGADFDKRRETNLLLGLSPNAGFMRGGASMTPANEEEAIVCWLKDEDEANGWVNVKLEFGEDIGKGYKAVLTFSERNVDEERNKEHIAYILGHPATRTRYVFWRETFNGAAWYKFYGKFQLDEEATRRENKCIYRRIASEVEINRPHNLG